MKPVHFSFPKGSSVSTSSNTTRRFSFRTAMAYLASTALLASGLVVGVAAPASATACSSGTTSNTFSGGDGQSAGTAWQISTSQDLIRLSELHASNSLFRDDYYIQTADISVTGCDWTPVGQANSFSGTYDGQGHTVAGLTVPVGITDYVGLFGQVSGTVTRVGAVNVSFNGDDSIGGLVGRLTSSGTVSYSFSTGTVAGRLWTGGLVGYSTGGTITASFSRADVTVSNTQNIANPTDAAGLVGNASTASTITNSYSTGAVAPFVPSTGTVGGLLGDDYSAPPTVTNSFWDVDTSSQSLSAGGTGKTTAEMKDASTFVAWSIATSWAQFNSGANSIWGICSLANDGYPYLLWQFDSDPCPTGSSSASASSEASAGVPGIFLYVAGPVGRTVGNSPVYYGADRVAAASEYEVRVLSNGAGKPMMASLASGELPINGSIPSTMVRLPQLEPGTYLVRMTGKHATGRTLELTSVITVGAAGTFTSIGPNIPVIR